MSNHQEVIDLFKIHYHNKFQDTHIKRQQVGARNEVYICSDKIKPGNEARLFLHPDKTKHTIVLAHGLSDSPHYVSAIGNAFFDAGANVIIPLMPAHGLKNPDEAMEELGMEFLWKKEIDFSTSIAAELGDIISLGGFSSGGALSYNKILRDPEMITGGLFLFSAAIDVALISDLGQVRFLSAIAKMSDGVIKGYGMDPFKYPKLPMFAALELGQIIHQNEELAFDKKITQPVFAAHAIDDKTAKLAAIETLIKKHAELGILFTLSNGMAHAELPLKDDIVLDKSYEEGKPAMGNKDFDLMMEACLSFYRKYVVGVGEKV